jgi:hypothetical protein
MLQRPLQAALRTRLLREINKANANLLAGVAGLKARRRPHAIHLVSHINRV